MKIIKQHDERDCGAACLAMIAAHHGQRRPLSFFRELAKTDQNGINLYGMCDAADKIGLKAEALSGNGEELLDAVASGEVTFPFVAHVITQDGMQHFVVVFAAKGDRFVIGDPANGKENWSFDRFFSCWTGHIVTFAPTDAFCKGNFTKGTLRKFFSLLKGQYGKLTTVIVLSLMISLIGIVGAFVFEVIIDELPGLSGAVCTDDCAEPHDHITGGEQSLIDHVVGFVTRNAAGLHLFFIALIALYVLSAIIQFARGYLLARVSRTIDKRLILPYYSHLLDLPLPTVHSRKTGEYLSRFSDASAVRDAISGATLTLLLDSLMVIGCGVILCLENPLLFLISLISVVLYAVIVLCYRRPLDRNNHAVMEQNARVQSYLKESIDGVETLKACGGEDGAKEHHRSLFTRLLDRVFKGTLLEMSQDALCDMIQLVSTVLILWIGFGMVLAGTVTIGSLITFYALLSYFTEPIKNLISLQPMLQTAAIAADRLNDVLESPVEEEVDDNTPPSFDTIAFSHVDFRYGNHELTLKDISFSIEKGQKIAVVGESGCGKTTLAKLLMKFYRAESGAVTVDGREIDAIAADTLRRDIAYVDQHPFLFSDTIRNNLTMGLDNVSDSEIAAACQAAKASEFIDDLPLRYDAYLEEGGKNLSGGQRQRLAIARALLRRPRLMILDEATSNLDAATEAAVRDAVLQSSDDVTCVIIAHRLNTIRQCDRILVMDDGRIVEQGTHDELLAANGLYATLYKKQL